MPWIATDCHGLPLIAILCGGPHQVPRHRCDHQTLWKSEPDFRAVVFTRFDEVQRRLVELCEFARRPGGCLHNPSLAPSQQLKIFEFNRATAPVSRHKRIAEFQQPDATGAKLFIVTYATAAVGITLTAASRVYLLEPCMDPAQVSTRVAMECH